MTTTIDDLRIDGDGVFVVPDGTLWKITITDQGVLDTVVVEE